MKNTITLAAIGRRGEVSGYSGVLGSVAAQAIHSTRTFYSRVGFAVPWISYLGIAGGVPVGICSFKSPPAEGRIEIAYFTFPKFEGRGYATNMASGLVGVAQNHDPTLTIYAQTLPDRNASHRILEKLGFRRIGEVNHSDDGVVAEWQLNEKE